MQNIERPWLKNYPAEMPATIRPEDYPNLVAIIDEKLKKYAARPAFTCFDKSLSFSDIDKYSQQFAAYLQTTGLKKGDKVALMMPNILQYPIALFGVLRAGMTLVNTNPLYTPREMKHQFNDSGAKAIVIIENFASHLQGIIAETSIEKVIVTSMGEMLGLKGLIVNYIVRKKKKLVPPFSLPGSITFKSALKIGAQNKFTPVPTQLDDVIALQYTGGTTGLSKGAMLTNRNLVANCLQMITITGTKLKDDGYEVAFCPLPLYHIYAFTVNCMGMFSMGANNILVPNPRDMASLIKDLKKYRPTIMIGINTLYNAMINNPEFQKLDFSQLKGASAGGMAVQRIVAERWFEITKTYMTEGWGMTETSPVASSNPFGEAGKISTIGMPLPSTDMRIVDDNLNPVPTGVTGEIQVRGPQVMKGYYNKPEATAEVIKDGWMCTGDIGIMDEDGYFKIVDRKKDMILVSGFNVYPNEIEDVIMMHPKVLEVAAIGVKDERSGEVPKVFIVKRDPSLTSEEIIAHCRHNLTGYKIPKYVEFRNDLPKTNVGKILRRQLRDS